MPPAQNLNILLKIMDLDWTQKSLHCKHYHIGIRPNARLRVLAPAGFLDSVRRSETRVMPPTAAGLQFHVNSVPPSDDSDMSCMDPSVHWSVVARPVALSGVGMDDCP